MVNCTGSRPAAIEAGTGVTIEGDGSRDNPYVISSTGGGGGAPPTTDASALTSGNLAHARIGVTGASQIPTSGAGENEWTGLAYSRSPTPGTFARRRDTSGALGVGTPSDPTDAVPLAKHDADLATKVSALNGVTGFWKGTQAEYDAVNPKVSTVIYMVVS